MDVTVESRYGDLVRQLNEYGNPAGVRVLVRSMDPTVACRTVVDGVLAFIDGGHEDAAERVLRHSVHVGISATDIIKAVYEAGYDKGFSAPRRVSKKPKKTT